MGTVIGISLIAAGVFILSILSYFSTMDKPSLMSVLANWFRRLLGRPEHPPAVSGEHSVLFILQSVRSATTLAELSALSRVSEDQLLPIMDKLERTDRICVTSGGPKIDARYKLYFHK